MMKSLFDLLEEDSSQKLISAVFMTYGFEADLFERNVLPSIFRLDTDYYENERRFRSRIAESLLKTPVTVFLDGGEYRGGKTFLYDLVNVSSCTFHSKCFLLLYQDYLRIIVGSSNITRAGMCYNAEILWSYDLKVGDSTGVASSLRSILGGFSLFLKGAENHAMEPIKQFLTEFPYEKSKGRLFLHSTLDAKSFSEQFVEELINGKNSIDSLRVISPFFESDTEKAVETAMVGRLLQDIKHSMNPGAKVEFCFPGFRVNDVEKWNVEVPLGLFKELSKAYPGINFYIVPNLWNDDGEEHVRNLHAKIIEVRYENGEYLYLIGSQNFTRAAMHSKQSNLRNFEIGVFESSKVRLKYPIMQKVNLENLANVERDESPIKRPVIFIEKAELDLLGSIPVLMIMVDTKNASYPFTVNYQNKIIHQSVINEAQIIISGFKIGYEKDLVINCGEYDFNVPIDVIQKYMVAKDDLGFDFEVGIEEILAYHSGKYRSIEELVNEKKKTGSPVEKNTIIIKGFRTNLNLFFKALDGIKQSLEKPSWTVNSFLYELDSPVGLKRLMELFDEGYSNGTLQPEEAFFYIIETMAKLESLNFQPDRIEENTKMEILREVSESFFQVLNDIIKGAKGNVRKQYGLMLKEYGIEVD